MNQIEATVQDKSRAIEKSRMSWEDARRVYKDNRDVDEDAEQLSHCVEVATGQKYDSEIYDDRQFYSMQLKVCPL
jgi:hypothetical protein